MTFQVHGSNGKKNRDESLDRSFQMRFAKIVLGLAVSVFGCAPALAEVKVSPIFASEAVFQREKPVAVFGTAAPGEQVSVQLGDFGQSTTANEKGDWCLKLPAMQAGGPFEMKVQGSQNRLQIPNIYVGEVWLCSGQSNMVLPTSFAKDSKDDIDKANNPELHLFNVEEQLLMAPTTAIKGTWKLATPEVVRDFSGVSYYFGRKVQAGVKVHVGIICSAYGGTPIKTWMSPDAIEASHDTTQINLPDNFIQLRQIYDKNLFAWQGAVAEARAKGLQEPAKPVLPADFFAFSSAFNGMIYPIVPYSLRGVVWYQGESDSESPFHWNTLFSCMISDWRKRWKDSTMPFLFVQVPAYEKRMKEPGESLWAELREKQVLARRVPYTYMACTIDTAQGDFIDVHPREKREVGERLANVALATVYKQAVPYSGPMYDSMEPLGQRIRVTFRYAEGGLVAKDGQPKGFEISGTDKKFYPAQARISGNTVVVWSDKVPEPVAVRYGWAANPNVNLFNKANLPVSPFRTDKWYHKWGKTKHV